MLHQFLPLLEKCLQLRGHHLSVPVPPVVLVLQPALGAKLQLSPAVSAHQVALGARKYWRFGIAET